MEVKSATSRGKVRENNEDTLWVGSQCLVVCDGMGGHLAGDVAASIAVKTIETFPFSGDNPQDEVLAAIEQAQAKIVAASSENEEYQGMGSTATVAWFNPAADGKGYHLTVGHVGDSRCYLYSNGVFEQLTDDHSVVGELLRSGTITAQEARLHPKKHILTQVLGSPEIDPQLITRELEAGSLVLLCTDGLSDMVEDCLITKTLETNTDSLNVAQELVDLANELGGLDNVTAIVAKL